MGFWVSSSDASGARIAGTEEQLSPAPAEVDYPRVSAGRVVETTGGAVVKQQPSRDPRRRAWVWQSLPAYEQTPRYLRMIRQLEGLLSTTRRARGLPPWVYLRDTETDALRVWRFDSGTTTAIGADSLTDASKAWAVNAAKDAVVEITSSTGQGQRRTVVSNTSDTLLLGDYWSPLPSGASGDYYGEPHFARNYFGEAFWGNFVAGTQATYSLIYPEATWIRCRVLSVSKRPMARAGVMYNDVRLDFQVEDPAFTTLD